MNLLLIVEGADAAGVSLGLAWLLLSLVPVLMFVLSRSVTIVGGKELAVFIYAVRKSPMVEIGEKRSRSRGCDRRHTDPPVMDLRQGRVRASVVPRRRGFSRQRG